MASEKKHRTWICSVLFTDIISYTKFDVEEQMSIRSHFYQLMDDELNAYSRDDFITLDAGDGMAVCYLGDPEDLLLMALSMRERFLSHIDEEDAPLYKVRLGINLGPVKIAELQGEKRVIGDAINVANRIMGFAGANQLYVSRSFYEVVSQVSKEYFDMFDFVGTREDKHVRKHDVYAVSSADQEDGAEMAANNVAESDFDAEFVDQVSAELALSVGPMAKILVKKAAAAAASRSALVATLAEEIDEPELRSQFVAKLG